MMLMPLSSDNVGPGWSIKTQVPHGMITILVNVLDGPNKEVHVLHTAVAKLALQDKGTKSLLTADAANGSASNVRSRVGNFMVFG